MIERCWRRPVPCFMFFLLLLTFTQTFAIEHGDNENNRPRAYSHLSVIASIDSVGDNQYEIVEFALKKNTILRVYAVGEWNTDISAGYDMVMSDYGGIENAETGQLVWEMHRFSTKPAGGSRRNRIVDRILPLPAGTYRLHYRSNGSHSFDNWADEPPDREYWGITLFDDTTANQEMLGHFWDRAATPEEAGWSSVKLNSLKSLLEELGSSALLIVTDNKIVFDWGNTTNNFRSHSTRKQLFSGLFGIYVGEGKIDTSRTMKDLDIRETGVLTEEEKQATILNLLTARSGVYIPAASESRGMKRMRPERGSHRPGTFWMYNNWDFNVLGTIFRQETGDDIYGAFAERIAGPVGMQDYILEIQEYGDEGISVHQSYPFKISARDMARFGQLFLDGGRWGDKQIIPSDWIAASTSSHSNTFLREVGFGYLWWVLTSNAYGMKKGSYFASGAGGQKIFILPEERIVIVHRLNITTPGVNIDAADVVPFYIMPRLMKAYTGEKRSTSLTVTRRVLPQRHLLKDYESIRQVRGIYYQKSRIVIYACMLVLFIFIVFYLVRHIARKVRHARIVEADGWAAIAARLVVMVNGLVCFPFLLILLDDGRALEELSIYDLSANVLNLPSLVYFITQIPLYVTLITGVALIFCLMSWVKKFWAPRERLVYTLIVADSAVFVWVTNNMITIG